MAVNRTAILSTATTYPASTVRATACRPDGTGSARRAAAPLLPATRCPARKRRPDRAITDAPARRSFRAQRGVAAGGGRSGVAQARLAGGIRQHWPVKARDRRRLGFRRAELRWGSSWPRTTSDPSGGDGATSPLRRERGRLHEATTACTWPSRLVALGWSNSAADSMPDGEPPGCPTARRDRPTPGGCDGGSPRSVCCGRSSSTWCRRLPCNRRSATTGWMHLAERAGAGHHGRATAP